MSQNFAFVSEMTSTSFYGFFSQKLIRKDHKRLNRQVIAAENPADAEVLTLIQKFLHHLKA